MSEFRDRGSRDSELIDLESEQEVAFWTSELEVDRADLHRAVAAVGSVAKDVRAYLAARFTRF